MSEEKSEKKGSEEKENKFMVGPGLGLIIMGLSYLVWWLMPFAFEAYFADKKEKKRHCADPTTVLYAVCGKQYFGEVGPGACVVREDGYTRWDAARDRQHFYNTQKLPTGELEQVMEQLLIKPPKLQR